MKIKFHIIYIFTIIVLVALLFRPSAKSDRVGELGNSVADTLSFISDTTKNSIIDTLSQKGDSVQIKYITKVVKDTVYIRDSITGYDLYLPIIQKHFSEKNRYDLWISGVEPLNIDRIDVYNQVKYETITNTITRTEYVYQPKRNELYFGGGFCSFLDTNLPIVGVSLKTKNSMLISLDYGHYKDNNLYLATLKFNLGKNK